MNSIEAISTCIKNNMDNKDKLKAIVSYKNIIPSPAYCSNWQPNTERLVLHRRTHRDTDPNAQEGMRGRDTGGMNQDR